MIEIRQTLWLDTPKGQGRAKFVIDAGDDADLQWIVVYEDGSFWTWNNYEVKAAKNVTMGIRRNEKK